jgi:hypothetical protein
MWFMLVIPALWCLRQKDLKFKASMGYIRENLSQKTKTQMTK